MVSRRPTPDELSQWDRLKKRGPECRIPACPNPKVSTHGCCQEHKDEFDAQRDTGYYDFRLWGLMKLGELPPEESTPIEAARDFNVAIRDVNAQAILRTFCVQLGMLMHEYDMQDTIFGEKIQGLMNEYEVAMNAR